MKNIIIKRISADETRGLRKKLLRPTQPNEKLFYYGDEFDDTYHAGAYDDNLLVGIASVCRENKPNDNTPKSWRLRGMAVENEYRRNNIGSKLLEACIEHIKKENGKHLWFNARLVAVEFYKTFGFEITSDIFEIEDIGPHYNMEKLI